MGRIIPYIMENIKCLKPPTSLYIFYMGLETIAKWSVLVPRSKCRTQWPSGAAAASQPTADPRRSLVKTLDFTVKRHGFYHAKGWI